MDPLTTALSAAKAERGDPGDFRALDGNACLFRLLIGQGSQVWTLQESMARDGKVCRDSRLGVRLGPEASEAYSQRVRDLFATPPGIRKAGFREVMEVARCPGQARHPPSVAPDAQLGFSATAYQSAEVPFDRCEGNGHISVRLVGMRARAHKANKD